MAARAYTTPEVLRWARESAAMSVEAAARRGQVNPALLADAERGDHFLTLRQAKLLAQAYGRSLATLFRSEPPEEPSTEARFRRLRGAPPPPWSSDLIKLERAIGERQEAAVEIYAALGERPPWRETAERLALSQRLPGPDTVRGLLDLEPPRLNIPGSDLWFSRRVVLRAIEWTGVMVIRQSLPDDGVRGFLAPHADVPAIYVNSEDPRAQAYTMIHEFAHLLLATTGQQEADEENWCEQYAGELLMPEAAFLRELHANRHGGVVKAASATARYFGVTPLAAAVRALRLEVFSVSDMVAVRDRPKKDGRASDGGDGNRTKVARLSPTFTDLVLAAADTSAITLSSASRLLRTKVDDFPKLRRYVEEALGE
jgi:Zn-dependent peptidase ImmA (M78 family)